MTEVQVSSEDVLKALKKFKRLAKQDILASEKTPDPEFWRAQAEFRRRVYDRLMAQVNSEGVAAACEMARKAYAELPLQRARDGASGLHGVGESPEVSAERQALELFFSVVGVPIPSAADGAAERPWPSVTALTSNA